MIIIKRFSHYDDVFYISGILDSLISSLDSDDSISHWYFDIKINELFIYFIFRVVLK